MEIPCKDCLCFPVCKSQAVREDFKEGSYISLSILDDKCELFSKWYKSTRYFGEDEIKKCFEVNSSTWFRGLRHLDEKK